VAQWKRVLWSDEKKV